MVDKKGDSVVDGLSVDDMVVVEHQHEIVGNGADLIQQSPEQHFDRWRLSRAQQGQCALAHPGMYLLQRGDEVGPEERGVIVALIKRDPCRGPFIGRGSRQPFGQQRSLAETRWRGDEGQLALDPLAQAFDQSLSGHEIGPPPGDVELGLK